MTYNVYQCYTNELIGKIRPFIIDGIPCITRRTYNKLMDRRSIGGECGIYADTPESREDGWLNVGVYNERYDYIMFDI